MAGSTKALLLAAALVPASHAADQIAYWTNPRAAVLRDQIYIEGGDRFNGDAVSATRVLPSGGSLYNISLCNAFTTAINETDPNPFLLKQDVTGTEADPPFFVGGAMFATDNIFYTYGGSKSKNGSAVDNGVIFGSIYQPVVSQSAWQWGITDDWSEGNLTATTRDLTQGSWTSAPSENLGFWFSGLRAADYGEVNYETSAGDADQASTPATDFMMFNLDADAAESFNMSWPAGVDPRAEGALVWLPYGNKGMLLAFGGIGVPADLQVSGLFPTYNDTNGTNQYMTDILVYDVDSQKWEHQQTAGDINPPQTASFCTVVATDYSKNDSHHIYVYGGYDGTYQTTSTGAAYDSVWVLSIPAFRWTKISDGVPSHRRQNHVCVNMNANTMLSIGGNLEYGQALNSTPFDVYDLSKTSWTGSYTPDSNAAYTVPDVITKSVGDVSTIPNDLTDQVKTWLGASYKKTITGPVLASCPSPPPAPTQSPAPSGGHSSSWKTPVAAAVASVGGVAIIAGLLWCFCIRRRRRGNQSEDTKRNSILSWVNRSSGTPAAPKSMPDSENTVIATPVDYFGTKGSQVEAYEMPSNAPSPGYNSYRHGSPQIMGGSATSPYMGSAEVDAQSRHEMPINVARGESSYGPNPYTMRSVSSRNNPMSVRSDSVSHASEAIMHSRQYGYVSPYELAQDRSREDLASPPADLMLNEPRAEEAKNASTHSLGVGADKVSSPVMMTPIAPITRTIDSAGDAEATEEDRPRHKRNQSSMSSNLPNLPSPGPEEDRRRSRLIETLPDPSSAQSSPIQPQTAKRSAYTENLDA